MAKRKGTTYSEDKKEKEIEELSESGKKDDVEEEETKEDITKSSEISTSSNKSDEGYDSPAGGKKDEDITDEGKDKENKEEVKEDEDENLPADLPAMPAHAGQADGETADAKSLPAGKQGSGMAKEEIVGEAMFQKGTNNKKNLTLIVIVIIVIALVLFARTNEGKNILATIGLGGESAVSEKYVNPIHKYAFKFKSDENSQLVVAGNIPAELELKGVKSMQDLNLTDGDALLIRTDTTSGDNIVYTVLELSKRGGYTTFDKYLEDLRVNLGNTTTVAGTEYVEKESVAGKEKLPAVEFSFEMDVLTDQESTETRVGVFYDTVFTAGDNAYSISFGYPKDIENAKYYIDLYRDMVASFTYNEEIEEETDEKVGSVPDDSEDTETETVSEDGEIEVVE